MKKRYTQPLTILSLLALLIAPILSLQNTYALVKGAPVGTTQVTDNTSTANSSPSSDTPSTSGSANNSTNSTASAHLANIKSKGDQEIQRRLLTLTTLLSKISSATKLTTVDKASLTTEVNTEQTGLTALKIKLNAETTVTGVAQDVASMVTEYRVYALLVPKVQIIHAADDQLILEAKLVALQTKLSTRISQEQAKGTDVSALLSQLASMETLTGEAQMTSTQIETDALALQPTDYDTNHSALTTYSGQLATVHTDNENAYNNAKTIVNDLKNL